MGIVAAIESPGEGVLVGIGEPVSESVEFILRTFVIGVGATLTMDGWALLVRQFGIPSLDFALLGRWIGHLARGRWMHVSIAKSSPIQGERPIGWLAHYTIGISFAALLVSTFGLTWARSPTLAPALIVGLVTALAPLFIVQPAMGTGIASFRTPRPLFNSLKSLVTHTVFGLGMYLSALASAALLPPAG